MKAISSVLFSVFLISGCSTIFTNSKLIEPGVYQITAHGNAFNSNKALLEKALKKADKRCENRGYEQLEKPVFGSTRYYDTTLGGYSNTPNVTIKVKCTAE